MLLIRVEETDNDGTKIYHELLHGEEELENIKKELEKTRESYLHTSHYFDYYIEEEDIHSIKIEELKGLTLREVKILLDYC